MERSIFWTYTSLKDIGLRVQLGHSDLTCACPVRGHTDFLVLHVNGIHWVNVDFCGCDRRVSHRQQLLRCDWFPSTVHQPQTACTRRVLEHFLLLTWSSKVSAFEYYQTLERLTDNTGISVPKVSGHSSLDSQILNFRIEPLFSIHAYDPGISPHFTLEASWARSCRKWNRQFTTRRSRVTLSCMSATWNKPTKRLGEHRCLSEVRVFPSLECIIVIPRFHRFLYYLIIAMDANFRLKNRT